MLYKLLGKLCSKIGWGGGISNSQLQNVINANKGRVIKGTFKVEDANTEVQIIGYKNEYFLQKQYSNDAKNRINIARTDPIERVEYIYIRYSNEQKWKEIDKKKISNEGMYVSVQAEFFEIYYILKEKINNKPIEDMSYMFSGCQKLESLDVTNFNTENVIDMSEMFSWCTNLTTLLGVTNFNTQNVTNMSYMFSECSKLNTLDVRKFDTKNVTNMSYMFAYCRKLDKLDLTNWRNDNVTDMNHMFCGCWILTTLTLTNFKTPKVINMSYMFYECKNLNILDLSSFNTENVTNMSCMFNRCGSLKKLNVIRFDIGKNADITSMFDDHNASLKVTYMLPVSQILYKILESYGIDSEGIYS